jgi:alanyl-tRNA synthetase
VDKAGFDLAMEAQRDKARVQSAFGGGRKGDEFQITDQSLASAGDPFEGYTSTTGVGIPVLALFDGSKKPVESLGEGEAGFAALARTPIYLEAGGQVSDTGRLVNEATGAAADVEGRVRPAGEG